MSLNPRCMFGNQEQRQTQMCGVTSKLVPLYECQIAYMRREIKFGALLERLHTSSSRNSWFATGHYARKSWTGVADGCSRPQLLRGLDPGKDQSYYLSSISEDALRSALFPLGELTKTEVRELARVHQLPTAERPESMGICFVGEKTKFNRFVCGFSLFLEFSFAQSTPSFIYSVETWLYC